MERPDPERLHPLIDAKLAAVAKALPGLPSWHDGWSRLGPGSTDEEKLEVCRTVRDSDVLPGDLGDFLVTWAAEKLAAEEDERRADPIELLNPFEAVRASDRAFPTLLERHGEARLAHLFRTDREEHDRRREAGRLFFFGPLPPDVPEEPGWPDALLRFVADAIAASEPVRLLRFRHRRDGEFREVHVSPPADGPPWAIDIEKLREAFDPIDGCGWYAAPAEGEAPYLWIEGEFDGRQVFLRVLAAEEEGAEWETWRRPRG